MATYKQLMAQKRALEAQVAEARAAEVAGVIEQIRSLMTDYELTAEDIAPKRGRGRPRTSTGSTKAALPPKYRNPKTGQTWSGRGRAPGWLGARPERFLIKSDE